MLAVGINSGSPAEVGTALLVVALPENPTLSGIAGLDSATQGALSRTLEMKDFRGSRADNRATGGADERATRDIRGPLLLGVP